MSDINVAEICPETKALGPGNRFVIWVQGCPFNCKGCLAPNWIPFKSANSVKIDLLANAISINKRIAGITISGGEPMMQAGRLAILLQLVQDIRPELNVIIFTGFKLSQLVWPEALALLSYTDLLIDGQYVEKKNDGNGLRGSNNQQFHFLTERLKPFSEAIITKRLGMEFHLLDDGVLAAGIPPPNFKW